MGLGNLAMLFSPLKWLATLVRGPKDDGALFRRYEIVLIAPFLCMIAWDKLFPRPGAASALDEAVRLEAQLAPATLSLEAIDEALWRAKLGLAAYEATEAGLLEKLTALEGAACELQKFSPQPVDPECFVCKPQWFVCSRDVDLYVVFRGTSSWTDVVADIDVSAESSTCASEGRHCQGTFVHRGFLHGAKRAWDNGMRDMLSVEALQNFGMVHFVGHSLGGALALTMLVAEGVLPELGPGKYSATTFGAPAVILGKQPLLSAMHHAAVQQWVFENDPVPRLLGNDLKTLRFFSKLWLTELLKWKKDIDADRISQYLHLCHAEHLWLRKEGILNATCDQRNKLFHLHVSFENQWKNGVASRTHHYIAEYIRALEERADRRNHRDSEEL